MMLYMILLLVALVLFLLSGFEAVSSRFNLIGLGLAAWVLVPLLQTIHKL